jgi:hypothetical protein
MRKTLFVTLALLALTAAAGRTQNLADQPGYVPIEKLDLFPRDKLSVEINIEGALLSLIAAGSRAEDPEFASLIAGLKSITVRAVPLKNVDAGVIRSKINQTVRWLEDRGWKSTLLARDEGEETHIYLKEVDGKIAGLTLLALDPADEAVVINIVGRIDPAQIGRISEGVGRMAHPDKKKKPQ